MIESSVMARFLRVTRAGEAQAELDVQQHQREERDGAGDVENVEHKGSDGLIVRGSTPRCHARREGRTKAGGCGRKDFAKGEGTNPTCSGTVSPKTAGRYEPPG